MNPFNFLSSIYNGNQSTKLLEMVRNSNSKFEEIIDEDVLVQDFKDNKQAVVD